LLDHNFIGTEHLLLGLARERDGWPRRALALLDIRLEVLRDKVKDTIGPAVSHQLTGSPPFTPRAKTVLELSLREALQLGHNYIGTEHILLGLVREGEGVAAHVLVGLGADLAHVRRQVLLLVAGSQHTLRLSSHSHGPETGTPALRPLRGGLVGVRPLRHARGAPGPGRDRGDRTERAERAERGPIECDRVLLRSLRGSPRAGAGGRWSPRVARPQGRPPWRSGHGVTATPSAKLPKDRWARSGWRTSRRAPGSSSSTTTAVSSRARWAWSEVHLSGLGRARRGSANGTWGEVALGAAWSVGDAREAPEKPSTPSPAAVPSGFGQLAVMSGRFGHLPIKVECDFELSPVQSLERAVLSGEAGRAGRPGRDHRPPMEASVQRVR